MEKTPELSLEDLEQIIGGASVVPEKRKGKGYGGNRATLSRLAQKVKNKSMSLYSDEHSASSTRRIQEAAD